MESRETQGRDWLEGIGDAIARATQEVSATPWSISSPDFRQSRQEHCRFLRMPPLPDAPGDLSQTEWSAFRGYVAWLTALVPGDISPLTSAQQRFVDAARRRTAPTSDFEVLWRRWHESVSDLLPPGLRERLNRETGEQLQPLSPDELPPFAACIHCGRELNSTSESHLAGLCPECAPTPSRDAPIHRLADTSINEALGRPERFTG